MPFASVSIREKGVSSGKLLVDFVRVRRWIARCGNHRAVMRLVGVFAFIMTYPFALAPVTTLEKFNLVGGSARGAGV